MPRLIHTPILQLGHASHQMITSSETFTTMAIPSRREPQLSAEQHQLSYGKVTYFGHSQIMCGIHVYISGLETLETLVDLCDPLLKWRFIFPYQLRSLVLHMYCTILVQCRGTKIQSRLPLTILNFNVHVGLVHLRSSRPTSTAGLCHSDVLSRGQILIHISLITC